MGIKDDLHEARFYQIALEKLENQGNRKRVQEARAEAVRKRDEALARVEEQKKKARRFKRKRGS